MAPSRSTSPVMEFTSPCHQGVKPSIPYIQPSGSHIHSELAAQLGAQTSEDGCMVVDGHQRTDVPGLYAAGDVVLGLDQISHAMGEGGVAATSIRNDLDALRPMRR